MTRSFYDQRTEIFERTEERLYEWGAERNRLARDMGMPTASSMSMMIERQRVFEQQLKGVKRKRPFRKVRTRDGKRARKCACGTVYAGEHCTTCGPQDPKVVAIGLGHADAPDGIRATETRSMQAPVQGFTSSVAEVQAAVDALPGWMQRCLYRCYQHRQPDRIAARELRMVRERYTGERIASVAAVTMQLAHRRECAVRSASPGRAAREPT